MKITVWGRPKPSGKEVFSKPRRTVSEDEELTTEQKFILPYPPTVNHYWGRRKTSFGIRDYIKTEGQKFRAEVERIIDEADAFKLKGAVEVNVYVHFPDRKMRDLDNLHKATYDALTHAGLWDDDSQIDREMWMKAPRDRFDPEKKGWIEMYVSGCVPYREPKKPTASKKKSRKEKPDEA